jgi:arabinofuranan 3-O-arabinosyltransferase
MTSVDLPIASKDAATSSGRQNPRLLGIFAAWRLRAYAGAVAIVYAFNFIYICRGGGWIVTSTGAPIYTDFTTCWVAGIQALRGTVAILYDPAEFLKIQTALLGAQDYLYPNWPYPPTFPLFMAPFALLPYFWAFVAWNSLTLAGCILVVYLITRQSPAIALVLASPFTAWNILPGQNAFLTASLLGAALLLLERRPVLAGVFIGCLTYKPQFGILIPMALAASRDWRAFASAASTAVALAVASTAAFGVSAWDAFPQGVVEQFGVVLLAEGQLYAADWGRLQSVYGLIRLLHGSGVLAWLGQAAMTLCAATTVWVVWRSRMRYALKAAVLSTAVLLASPYVFTYDLAIIAIPVAFLAGDQIRCGLLRGEQTLMLGMFAAVVLLLFIFRDPPDSITFGSLPIGPVLLLALLGIALRRAFSHSGAVRCRTPSSST